MLTRNLWISKGLCYGTRGIVHSIVYDDKYATNSLPIAVIVKFDSYKGPTFANLELCVPITPLACQIEKVVKYLRGRSREFFKKFSLLGIVTNTQEINMKQKQIQQTRNGK